MTIMFKDAPQQALSFLVQQAAFIEPQLYEIKYPDIQYPNLIPIDTSAGEWAKTVTFFSANKVGAANWFHHEANDTNRAEVKYEQHNEQIHMAEVGYGYTLEEIGFAMRMGRSLEMDRAAAARRAYEEFVDRVALLGDDQKGIEGLTNNSNVTVVDADPVGTGSSPDWRNKTADQILADINTILAGGYIDSLTVELADTLLLPVEAMVLIGGTKRLGDTDVNLMRYLRENNLYTQMTGQPLTIRAVRGLDTAGEGGTGRMVAYRRSAEVLKMHLPMPHRFLTPYQTGPLRFDVPGIFRLGGVEIRRPGAVRYMDEILIPATA